MYLICAIKDGLYIQRLSKKETLQLPFVMRVFFWLLLFVFLHLSCSIHVEVANGQPHVDTLSYYVPTLEQGRNAGPKVPVIEALKYMGFGKGTPYCAATVSWCLDITDAKSPKVRTALATRFLKSDDRVLYPDVISKRDTVFRGDIVVWRRGNGYKGHAGFVDSTWTGKCGWTVEANTTNDQGQEGIFRKYRCIKPSAHFSIVGFVRTKPKPKYDDLQRKSNCHPIRKPRTTTCRVLLWLRWGAKVDPLQ